ncbi:MAG: ribonuclease Y, partial [Clostridia bacterium]|nr:ribonuclease Y [Clostridia bacterium]
MPPFEQTLHVLLPILAAVISAVVFFFIGIGFRKKVAEREIGSAEEEATRILNDAIKSAEAKKREAMVEAKEEILRNRNEAEREIKEQRQDLSKHEKRIQQKEETLDRKIDNAEKKEETLDRKIKEADEVKKKLEEQKLAQQEALEKISGFTTEEAKSYLLKSLEDDLQHESALKIKEMEAQVRDASERKAREIISFAISKCAADYVADATVSVVNLPNDEMKGRIIGREGRNIRAIETITGVDLIIDDTPEAITLSCFDPVRREIARNALEKLIADGRIHPARIEEMVEKSRREVEQLIKQDGEKACFETSVHGLHPELVKILGRLRYRTSYGQNVLKHSIEVAHIAGYLASEVGADVVLARRAGLLHDIGKALDRDMEGSHVQIGVDIAKKYKENFEVVHAIHAHHGDVEPQT